MKSERDAFTKALDASKRALGAATQTSKDIKAERAEESAQKATTPQPLPLGKPATYGS